MADDLITRLCCYFLRQIVHQTYLRVNDFTAAQTDEMWMGIRPAAIETIVIVTETELEYFAQLLQKIERFVDGRGAGRGELDLDLLVQM